MRKLPSQAVLHEWLDYDQVTGIFRWKKTTRGGRRHAGDIAGTQKSVYIYIGINGLGQFGAHRLAWIDSPDLRWLRRDGESA